MHERKIVKDAINYLWSQVSIILRFSYFSDSLIYLTTLFQAVMIDMEEGVVNEILKGPLRDVFDCQQLITDVSGSGNNW